MHRILASALAGAVVLCSAGAFAETATGTIKTISPKSHMLTLSNGMSYALPSTMKLNGYKPGDKVALTFNKTGSKNVIEKMTAAR